MAQGVFGACCLLDGIGCGVARRQGAGRVRRFMCHHDADCAAGERLLSAGVGDELQRVQLGLLTPRYCTLRRGVTR